MGAVGIGLGGSAVGFLLSSAQTYMQLSKVMTQLRMRFREIDADTTSWGRSLGFTRSQAAQLMTTLGGQVNAPSEGMFQQLSGFAVERGIDPSLAMSTLGGLSRMGANVTPGMMAMFAGRADRMGMGQGRMGEYMQTVGSYAQMSMQAGGRIGPAFGGLTQTPEFLLGDERGRGQAGVGFAQRLQGVMTQGGPMRSYMMRAMGYGSSGGPGYIEMRKRLERGITDPNNLSTLFRSFQQRGMGRGAMFRALESVAGGSLKAHELESIVDSLGSEGGLADFERVTGEGSDAAAREEFLSGMTADQRKAFESTGFHGLARERGGVSMGAWREVQMEDARMAVGRPMAEVMIDMTEAIKNTVGTMGNLFGADGEKITELTGAIVGLTETAERWSAYTGSIFDPASRAGAGLRAGAKILAESPEAEGVTRAFGAAKL